MNAVTIDPQAVQEAIMAEDLAGLRQALENSPLAHCVGIEFTEFGAGRAAAVLRGSPDLTNFLGYSHTGALFALAEQVMAAAANSLGHVGLPLDCEVRFLKGADPCQDVHATARVVDTQGRIARVSVDVTQGDVAIAQLNETVFLRSGGKN
ncbi:MAG: PaaI family thioesterase [Deferrisomatales bacterium]|nr:PaaI family thioesterase [Deferrisomatales bacterium]